MHVIANNINPKHKDVLTDFGFILRQHANGLSGNHFNMHEDTVKSLFQYCFLYGIAFSYQDETVIIGAK
jgi:hypothetical protein